MAGDFFQSSHYRQWILSRSYVQSKSLEDLKIVTKEESEKFLFFFTSLVQSLGECLKFRQQIISTAIVYCQRFCAINSFRSIDPFLLGPTALYLATKIEEFGVLSQSRFLSQISTALQKNFEFALPPELSNCDVYRYRIEDVHACEFFLLESLDCSLIVFLPYRPLTKLIADLTNEMRCTDTSGREMKLPQSVRELRPTAWKIINDSMKTDVCLYYPPHMIDLSCLLMAIVVVKRKHEGTSSKGQAELNEASTRWFAELNVNMDNISEIIQRITDSYDLAKSMNLEIQANREEIRNLVMKLRPKTNHYSVKTEPSRMIPMGGSGGGGMGSSRGHHSGAMRMDHHGI